MFTYRFSNLLGAAHRGGHVRFSRSAHNEEFDSFLLTPVGNRVQLVDLVNNRATTLAPEARGEVARICLTSCAAKLLLAIDVDGYGLIVNLR